MTKKITICLAQMNQKMGDMAANADAMLRMRDMAHGAALLVFPELQLIGYPPEDMVMKPSLVDAAQQAMEKLARATKSSGPAMLVGTVTQREGHLYNGMALLRDGVVETTILKHDLPNYGTFDEKRLFASAPMQPVIEIEGLKIGVPICEDIWFPAVAAHYKAAGAQLLIVPNGSPFRNHKLERRINVVRQRVTENGLPICYVNRVGGQDELVFDGASFVMDGTGKIIHQMPEWQEALAEIHIHHDDKGDSKGGDIKLLPGTDAPLNGEHENLWQAIVTGVRDYVNHNGFPGVLLGLSGGIDSALSAAVAVDALGPDRVWCVMMPSRYTGDDSLDDAKQCADMLGCRYDIIPIGAAVEAFDGMLADSFADKEPDTTEENIQSRVRGVTLMALSNKFGHMLLTTGNKSEMAVGYATIYGDMAGGYNPLKDLYKTQCFALARWRNAHLPKNVRGKDGSVMPERIITKPPTAELRENQRDDDSLPPYEVLDPVLHGLIEEELSVSDIAKRGYDPDMVARIEKLLYIAEYKRRQAPPGVRVSQRNFGRDRRYPITNAFRTASKQTGI